MSFKIPKKIWLEHFGEEVIKTIRLATIVFGISLVVFLILEQFKIGSISNSINISLMVAVELLLLISLLFFGHRFRRRLPRKRWVIFGVLLSLIICLMILILTGQTNITSIIMSIVATVITYIVWYSYVYEN